MAAIRKAGLFRKSLPWSTSPRNCELTAPPLRWSAGFTPTQDARLYFNYHHTAADTFDKVDPRELNENAAVMAVPAYALADAPVRPPR